MRLLPLERVSNLAITHIITLGEFIFLSLYFRAILKEDTFLDKYFRIYLGIVGGLIIANTLFIEKINVFNTNAKILVLFLIIIWIVYFFYDRSKKLMEVDIHEKAIRLINSGLLLYYSGSFFWFLFYKFTINNEVFYSHKVLIFNAALYLFFTIIVSIAILRVVFHRTKSTTE
ncbi:MAG: hypothetical protein AAFO82_17895 [Bacteroidota bacterium]